MPCVSSHVTLVSTAPGPTLTMGIPAHGLGVSQMLFSPGHQHRPIEIRTQDCIQPGAGSTVVLAPSPHVPAHKVYSCESYTCCDTVVGVGEGGGPAFPFRCSSGAEVTKTVVGVKALFVQL